MGLAQTRPNYCFIVLLSQVELGSYTSDAVIFGACFVETYLQGISSVPDQT